MVSSQKHRQVKNSNNLTNWLAQTQEKKPSTDNELQKALELSQKEHIAEQQRIFQQVKRLNKGKQPVRSRPLVFPLPKPNDEDEDDFFQTVSTRPPLIKKEKTKKNADKMKSQSHIKKEGKEEEEEQLIIDDVTEWLDAKKEKEEEIFEIDNVSKWLQEEMIPKREKQDEEEETLEIEDVSAWLEEDNQTNGQDPTPSKKKQRRVRCHICNQLVERDVIRLHTRECTMMDEDDNNSNMAAFASNNKQECPICFGLFNANEIEAHSSNCNIQDNNGLAFEFNMERQVYDVESGDSSSECSFIDMSSSQFNEASIIPQQDEEDSGYLSPLEGHVNILDNPERYQAFFNQFDTSSSRTARKPRTTTQKKRTPGKRSQTQNYFARRNYMRSRGRGKRK
ncbi:hypothetical protein K501DRAFT_328590 [Backusella circina FSU 941]|nr:hypothetical protein K501DRAFT_328590 [Backusella circina FSU 941]